MRMIEPEKNQNPVRADRQYRLKANDPGLRPDLTAVFSHFLLLRKQGYQAGLSHPAAHKAAEGKHVAREHPLVQGDEGAGRSRQGALMRVDEGRGAQLMVGLQSSQWLEAQQPQTCRAILSFDRQWHLTQGSAWLAIIRRHVLAHKKGSRLQAAE